MCAVSLPLHKLCIHGFHQPQIKNALKRIDDGLNI